MSVNDDDTVRLGDLVVAVFDEAALYSTDARVVSQLGAQAVAHVLRHMKRVPTSLLPPEPNTRPTAP